VTVTDILARPMRSLRLSVTDRCNLRCLYCMPEEDYAWLPRDTLLSFEELTRVVRIFVSLGITRVRLTGGEPLVRSQLPALVRQLAGVAGVEDLAMTTNGVLLAEHAAALRAAGLQRITVSLDTLRRDRFQAFTRRDLLDRVLEGITAVGTAGFTGLKLDTVVLRGRNDDELPDLIEFARSVDAEVRFIEYMDVGGATGWRADDVFSRAGMLAALARRYGRITALPGRGPAPAERFRLPDGTTFGIIASTTAPFCRACDRSRVTADGMWLLCLYAQRGVDLREPLRAGAGDDALAARIAAGWQARADRGAEERAALGESRRGALVELARLRRDPHLEMHTRGG
jgi:cyclic pyranopterin phosphate synthase